MSFWLLWEAITGFPIQPRAMIRINLIPRRVRKKAAILRKQLGIMGAVVLVSLILSYGLNASISGKIEDERRQITAKSSRIDTLKATKLKELDTFEKIEAEKKERVNVVEKIEKESAGPVRVLDTLASKIPPQSWLENLKEEGPTLKVTGWTADNLIVARFMSSLQASPFFKEVELESVTQEDFQVGEGPAAKKFRLNKFSIVTKPSYR